MSDPDLLRQIRTEVAETLEYERRHSPNHRGVPPEETVEAPPPDLYQPPPGLHRIAGVDAPAWASLLNELREVNADWAGERTIRAEAHFAATGDHVDLERRIRAWVAEYTRVRSDDSRLNPMNGNDRSVLASQVVDEVASALGPLSSRPRTLNHLFLRAAIRYPLWSAFERVVRPHVVSVDGQLLLAGGGDDRAGGRLLHAARAERWLDNRVEQFCHWIGLAGCEGRHAVDPLTDAELLGRIQAAAEGIQSTRPFLVRHFNPLGTAVELAPGRFVAWDWQMGGGIGLLLAGESERDLLAQWRKGERQFGLGVNHAGLLYHGRMPWSTSDTWGRPGGIRPLAVNCIILERIGATLGSLFDRIDLERWSRDGRGSPDPAPLGEEGTTFEDDVQAVAAACCRLARAEQGAPAGVEAPHDTRPIPRLRMGRFVRVMERLGCEAGSGKGSEVKLTRQHPDAKVCILGRHTRNPEVHPWAIVRALGKLALTPGQFLTAVHGELRPV